MQKKNIRVSALGYVLFGTLLTVARNNILRPGCIFCLAKYHPQKAGVRSIGQCHLENKYRRIMRKNPKNVEEKVGKKKYNKVEIEVKRLNIRKTHKNKALRVCEG